MEPSLFLFQFRLLPWTACVNFNFDGVRLPDHWAAVCTRDLLGLSAVAFPENFDALAAQAANLAAAFIDAHAYFSFPSHPALDIEQTQWFEVSETGPRSITFGYADPSLQLAPLIAGHPDNVAFREAAALLSDESVASVLGPALADFRVARRELGVYCAFYAFRVLEDIAYSFGQQLSNTTWGKMNKALGKSENYWAELTKWGKAVRHRAPDSPRYLLAEKRSELLGLAKEAIDLWIAHQATARQQPRDRPSDNPAP